MPPRIPHLTSPHNSRTIYGMHTAGADTGATTAKTAFFGAAIIARE